MKLCIDRLSILALNQPNFSLLKDVIARCDTGPVTGYAVFEETPFLQHPRLRFVGTGEYSDTVLRGPAFSPQLLKIPAQANQLREIVGEFLKQVRQLDDSSSLDIPDGDLILCQNFESSRSGHALRA